MASLNPSSNSLRASVPSSWTMSTSKTIDDETASHSLLGGGSANACANCALASESGTTVQHSAALHMPAPHTIVAGRVSRALVAWLQSNAAPAVAFAQVVQHQDAKAPGSVATVATKSYDARARQCSPPMPGAHDCQPRSGGSASTTTRASARAASSVGICIVASGAPVRPSSVHQSAARKRPPMAMSTRKRQPRDLPLLTAHALGAQVARPRQR